MTHNGTAEQPVLVIMGVSGSGKSTVAGILAGQLGWDLEEGDDLHPAENVAKMAAGQPLTDEDRWPWLDEVAAWITEHTAGGTPGIITCSALKRIYRDRMRGPNVVFVHLAGSKDEIGHRLPQRTLHAGNLARFANIHAGTTRAGREHPGRERRRQTRRHRRGDHRPAPSRAAPGWFIRYGSPRMNRGFSGSDSARTHDLKP